MGFSAYNSPPEGIYAHVRFFLTVLSHGTGENENPLRDVVRFPCGNVTLLDRGLFKDAC